MFLYICENEQIMRTIFTVQQTCSTFFGTAATTNYCSNLVYDGTTLKMMLFDGGYATMSGSFPTYHYYLRDHLGSNRVLVKADGTVEQLIHYYPYGGEWSDATGSDIQPYKYTGKELDKAFSLNLYDYGARHYDPSLCSWTGQDPLGERYYGMSSYGFCVGNPVKFIDSDGREVRGITKQDAQTFRDDIYKVLADDKFANVRTLIDIKGKMFKSIDVGKLSSAMEGLTLTDDESAYITMITGAINSKDIYKVEYVSGEYTSSEGAKAFVNHTNKELGEGIGDRMVTPDGKLSYAWIRNFGDGLNVPTQNGSHSFIGGNLQGSERAVTSGHEVFGHGVPAAKKLTPAENNANAIRTDNLIRRILGLPQRDGSNHGGYKMGHITNPYILPILK